VKGTFIYATNFRCGTVDVFDVTFKAAKPSGSFHDSDMPDGFAPFGIANIRGNMGSGRSSSAALKNPIPAFYISPLANHEQEGLFGSLTPQLGTFDR